MKENNEDKKTALVICADKHIFPLLVGLIRSLNFIDKSVYKTCIIDIGMTNDQIKYISKMCDFVTEVKNDLLILPHNQIIKMLDDNIPFWKAQLCRPFIREYFPGYHRYIHIDADTWFQNTSIFDDVVDIIDHGEIAIVPEVDISYPIITSHAANRKYFDEKRLLVTKLFGEGVSDMIGNIPYYNTGMFGIPGDTPHWDIFREHLYSVTRTNYHFLSEQLCFNVSLFEHGRFKLLPATCNWMCNLSPPIKGADGKWCSPARPYNEIDMLHLSGSEKIERYKPAGLLYSGGSYLSDIDGLL